jgi:hypothetical protein
MDPWIRDLLDADPATGPTLTMSSKCTGYGIALFRDVQKIVHNLSKCPQHAGKLCLRITMYPTFKYDDFHHVPMQILYLVGTMPLNCESTRKPTW